MFKELLLASVRPDLICLHGRPSSAPTNGKPVFIQVNDVI